MEGIASPNGATSDYLPMGNCESDDSQSNASKSDDNDVIPGITYTSDDSADIGQSDSTFVDSDAPNYIAQCVNQGMEDELSGEFLLAPCSPQPLTQENEPFLSRSVATMNINYSVNNVIDGCMGIQVPNKNHLYVNHPKVNLQVNPVGESMGLSRSTSISSSSTEPEFTPEAPFLSEYEPLSCYPDDEAYTCGLNFEAMKEDPIKSQVIHEQLNRLPSAKDLNKRRRPDRFYVGDVHIDPEFMDAFYVKWNWPKIRQTCVFINLSLLIGFFCVGVGLLVQMPVGSECDPVMEWWQGTVSYYIFIPSFLDSNGNGVGDIKGIISKLDYIEHLGVRTVRLSSIFESEDFLKASVLPSNYSTVAKVFGENDDLQLLAALLHERNMFLTIDLPLAKYAKTKSKSSPVHSPSIDLLNEVSLIIHKWTELGVDGFIFIDIDQLSHTENLLPSVQKWRSILDRKSRRSHRRIMMVPLNLLTKMEAENSLDLADLLSLVNLVDVYIQINKSAENLALLIIEATHWDTKANLPWINWNIGGVGYHRLSSFMMLSEGNKLAFDSYSDLILPSLGPTIFQLFLPGSVTLYYGDEIASPNVQESLHEEVAWAVPMSWSPTSANGGFSEGNPWLPIRREWQMWNVDSLNQSLQPLRDMIKASQEKVPLYINGIFKNVGDYHPTKATNYKIRLASDDLLILDRFYPRRNKYMMIFNLGNKTKERNFSKLYFGGYVIASSHGKAGYIRFYHIILEPGEALACVLDK